MSETLKVIIHGAESDFLNVLEKLSIKDEPLAKELIGIYDEVKYSKKLRILHALTRIGTEEVFNFFKNRIFDKNEDKRLAAKMTILLGSMGHIEAVPLLANCLKVEDKRIKANAVEALAAIGGKEARELLVPLLKDKDNRVRANAALALWKYDDLKEHVLATFEDMLKDNSKWMKASAYYAFGEIGLPQFTDILMEALKDKEEVVAKNAVIALIGYAEKFA